MNVHAIAPFDVVSSCLHALLARNAMGTERRGRRGRLFRRGPSCYNEVGSKRECLLRYLHFFLFQVARL